ncbi:MAG: tail fiber protein [Bacteroidota bacterium]
MEGYLAEIRMFGGNFAPRGWAFCAGQIMSIAQNTALFALLGTTYGGNGQTTFALPDLRSRSSVGTGSGPGLPSIDLGEQAGSATETLLISNLPAHNHTLAVNNNTTGMAADASGNYLNAKTESAESVVAGAASAPANLNAASLSIAGGSQPFNNRQPYLGMNFIVCMEGIFPSRN